VHRVGTHLSDVQEQQLRELEDNGRIKLIYGL